MKNWEVIKALYYNPKLQFKNLRFGGVLGHLPDGAFGWVESPGRHKGEAFSIHYTSDNACGNWNDDWEQLPQEVTWQEALESWIKGVDVIRELEGTTCIFSECNSFTVSRNELIRGKWYIKE